jgi:DNA-binding beta-propeller fold protein YncE
MEPPPKGEDMRLLLVCLTVFLLLTACAAPAQPTLLPTEASEPESEIPLLDGTFQTSLLVTEWRGNSEGNVLFPLDPASGTALPGYTPLSLGSSSYHAFSPDHKTLAVVSFPTETTYHGSLLLIDLSTWKAERFELDLKGWVNSLTFSLDGKRLAIAHGEFKHQVTVVDVEKGVITAQREIDSGFVSRLKFTKNGEALMLYTPSLNPEDRTTAGAPQVLLLNAADLTTRWSAELDGVHDGIFPKDDTVTSATIYEPGQAFYISPGLVFAPDREALYIVHADSNRLTTVDFESREIKTVEVQPKLTWFERLLSATAGIAHAKIGDGITREAAISPDGQFLYVVGVNNATFKDEQGNWQMEQTPLGLDILQTSDGSRLNHIETDTTEFSLSPDGRFLYLRNWGNGEGHKPWTEIYDTTSGGIIARKTGISGMPALLMNGEYILASMYSTSETSHHMSVLEPDGSNVLAEWIDSRDLWWITAS